MKSLYIKDLQKNQLISDEVFLIFECEKNEDKNGKQYCSLVIGDKTGKIQAKIWADKLMEINPSLLKPETLVAVSAKVDEFKGSLQLNIYDLSAVDETKLDDFLQTSKYDPEEMMSDLMKCVDDIKNEDLKKILAQILSDKEINKRLKFWPAAATVHHDFRSGLIQHVLEMIEISKSMKKFYPEANYDILTAGIILHDLGKIYELYASKIAVDYSKEGILVGHIVRGVLIFESYAVKDGKKLIPEDLYLNIVHLILSHHGSKEFGSPVLPSTIEAIMLTNIDNLSAKSRTAVKARDEIVDGKNFGSYNNWLSGIRIWNGGSFEAVEDSSEDVETNEVSDEDLAQLTF